MNFDFRDDDLGNVPQFNSIVLDFGYVTGRTQISRAVSRMEGSHRHRC